MEFNRFLRIFAIAMSLATFPSCVLGAETKTLFWNVQSVDTAKYSRDLAREKLSDLSFDSVIERQVSGIASLGATHIAISTPYDSEFIPFLKRWVYFARKYNLKVWFRGNWSGWEGWFDYPILTRADHIKKTSDFINGNKYLFEEGDIFTGCPECENGGPTGDPRQSGDVAGHRKFLIDEHNAIAAAFSKINKNVNFNFNSMNGDVARIIMDRATTKALGGIVAIDHYVKTTDKLISDIKEIQSKSGGRIVLGEIGVPIPDIHGRLTESEQAKWIDDAFSKLVKLPDVVGINYWLSYGGSASIWKDDGTPRMAVSILKKFYSPEILSGYVTDVLSKPIHLAMIQTDNHFFLTNKNGYFEIPYIKGEVEKNLLINADGYLESLISVKNLSQKAEIKLEKKKEGFWFKFFQSVKSFFTSIF